MQIEEKPRPEGDGGAQSQHNEKVVLGFSLRPDHDYYGAIVALRGRDGTGRVIDHLGLAYSAITDRQDHIYFPQRSRVGVISRGRHRPKASL